MILRYSFDIQRYSLFFNGQYDSLGTLLIHVNFIGLIFFFFFTQKKWQEYIRWNVPQKSPIILFLYKNSKIY